MENKYNYYNCRVCGGDKLVVCTCLPCYIEKREQIEELIVSRLCGVCKLKVYLIKKQIIKIEGIKELEYLL